MTTITRTWQSSLPDPLESLATLFFSTTPVSWATPRRVGTQNDWILWGDGDDPWDTMLTDASKLRVRSSIRGICSSSRPPAALLRLPWDNRGRVNRNAWNRYTDVLILWTSLPLSTIRTAMGDLLRSTNYKVLLKQLTAIRGTIRVFSSIRVSPNDTFLRATLPNTTIVPQVRAVSRTVSGTIGLAILPEYRGSRLALQGPWYDFLDAQRSITVDRWIILTDHVKQYDRPTVANVRATFERLTAAPPKKLWILYSGHGTQTRDTGKDESDKKDEATYLLDGMILDDEWHRFFYQLPAETSVFGVFDMCHAGTIGDLPYVVGIDKPDTTSSRVLANVVTLAGTRDNSYSIEWTVGGVARGLLGAVFWPKYRAGSRMTASAWRSYLDNAIQQMLPRPYRGVQTPVIASSRILGHTSLPQL